MNAIDQLFARLKGAPKTGEGFHEDIVVPEQGRPFFMRECDARRGLINYREYLRSEKWERLRAQVFARAGGRCERCHVFKATAVHHDNYENLGFELTSDLTAVCRRCHLFLHFGGSAANDNQLDLFKTKAA